MKIILEVKSSRIPQSFEEWAKREGLVMRVVEREAYLGPAMRYCAKFDGVDVVDEGEHSGVVGDGATPEAAVAKYRKAIQGCRLYCVKWIDAPIWDEDWL